MAASGCFQQCMADDADGQSESSPTNGKNKLNILLHVMRGYPIINSSGSNNADRNERGNIMGTFKQQVADFIAARRGADARALTRGRISADEAARDERGYVLLESLLETNPDVVELTFNSIQIGGTDQIIMTAKQCGHNITVKGF